jgi:serine/threonine-protein kinase
MFTVSIPVTTSLRDTLQQSLADRYTIEHELGRGGMATVYVAQDVRHRRRVAFKVLHPELSAVLGPDCFSRRNWTTELRERIAAVR